MTSKTWMYILKRVLMAILTVFIVITITFFSMNAIPGGPFTSEKSVSPEVEAAMMAKYGLDKPLGEQYLTYLGDIFLRFDFGPSIKTKGRAVIDIILDGFGTSALIGGIAAVLAIILGITFGTIAAINRNKFVDKLIMVLTTAANALPAFIIGSFLMLIFCVELRLLPANGSAKGGLILPIITLSLYPMAYITRLTRSSMLDVLGQDYIRTARAKGVSWRKTTFGHALKNALIPVITYVGPMLAGILTGSLVVEQIFAVGGLGRYFVNSITGRDYPLIMGTTIFLATLIVFANLISDIMYKVVDPRIELK
ncbi:MAG: ABC transporter permease [Clostridia bacterium]|nr:ABC transporter permease [Clostridia bacterium]